MRIKFLFILLIIFVLFVGCGKIHNNNDKSQINNIAITDVYGNVSHLPQHPRVVSAYGSFSECWILSGGELIGVTDDAIKERNINLPEHIEIIGTVKDINLEKVIALNPDFVILSADIASQASIGAFLDDLNISYGYFRIDSFEDYSKLMRQFCDFHAREDLYTKNVLDIENQINDIVKSVFAENSKTYLLMRVYSTGIKVKTDNIADKILKDLGCVSITDKAPSILNELSIEEIIKNDPDHIFVLTMGDEKAGEQYFYENIVNNSAWSGLSAIKNKKFHILPKDLFHYKPNNRRADSYKYIADIIYTDIDYDD